MISPLLIALIVISAVGVVMWIINNNKHESEIEVPYVPGEPLIYDEEYGLCFIKSGARTSEDGMEYVMEADREGKVKKVYSEKDLLEANKHLNILGRRFIITAKAAAILDGKNPSWPTLTFINNNVNSVILTINFGRFLDGLGTSSGSFTTDTITINRGSGQQQGGIFSQLTGPINLLRQ